MFHLRSVAGAVLVGAGTLPVDPFIPVGKGRERPPLAIALSRNGKLRLENRFFGPPGARLVGTTAAAPPRALLAIRGAGAEVETFGETEVDLAKLLARLREREVRFLLCEGGPTLAGQLLGLG